MTIGIYLLSFNGTHKVYIGQSRISIEKRYTHHRAELQSKTHSAKLNKAFAEYGMPECEILEECGIKDLDAREKYHIQLWDSVDDGFNTLREAQGGHLEGEYHPNSLHSNEDVLVAFNLLVDTPSLSYEEVASITGVGKNIVSQIANGITHKWISREYPEKYAALLSIKGTRINGTSSAEEQGIVYPPILSPEGIVHSITNLQHFAKEHGLEATNLCKVLHRKRLSVKGWHLQDTIISTKYGKVYKILSPTGEVFEVTNVSEFSRNHGLNNSSLSKVLRGEGTHHKGYRLFN